MSEPGTVWLVGMMGSGKSTVGRALARRLGRRFVDTDREVERAAGRSVAEIFAGEGEPAFRRRERDAIEACAGEPAVVALGGGAIAEPGAAARLAGAGTVVYLRASLETLLARVGAGEARPLLEGLSEPERRRRLGDLLEARRAAYESAAVVIDTDRRSPQEVAEALAQRLGARASA